MNDLIPTARLLPLIERFEQENSASNRIWAGLARRLYRVRHEDEFVTLQVADRLLVDMDMTDEWHLSLADLYEIPGQTALECAPPPPRLPAKFPIEKFRAAVTLYERARLGIPEIADGCWRELGYPTRDACIQSISEAMSRAGVPRRTLAEAKLARWSRERCAGCGCRMDERTRGCQPCTSRHYLRQKRGRGSAPAVIFNAACAGCGVPYAQRTYACRQCIDRHSHRRSRAPVNTPGLGRLSAGAATRRGTDGGTTSKPLTSSGLAPAPRRSPRRGATTSQRKVAA